MEEAGNSSHQGGGGKFSRNPPDTRSSRHLCLGIRNPNWEIRYIKIEIRHPIYLLANLSVNVLEYIYIYLRRGTTVNSCLRDSAANCYVVHYVPACPTIVISFWVSSFSLIAVSATSDWSPLSSM